MLPINTLTCTVLTPPSEEIVLVGSLAGSGDPAATPYPTIAHLHNPIMNQPTSRITNGGEPYTDRHRSTESATHSSQIFPYSAYWGSRLESRIGRKAQSNLDCRGLFRRRTVPSVLWKGCFKCHWRSREWWWFCCVARGCFRSCKRRLRWTLTTSIPNWAWPVACKEESDIILKSNMKGSRRW